MKYQISYKVDNVITSYNDCQEFYWKLLDSSNGISCKKITGNIKLYQILVSTANFLNLPLIYVSLKLNFPVWTVWGIRIIIDLIIYLVRCIFLNIKVDMSLCEYFKEVLQPVFWVTLISLPIPILFEQMVEGYYSNFIGSIILALICTAIATFFIGLKKGEREKIIFLVKNKFAQ